MVFGGGTVKSVSKKHDVVTAATQYSEYIGQFHALQNIMAARNMLEELGPVGAKYIESPTCIAGDNACTARRFSDFHCMVCRSDLPGPGSPSLGTRS